MHVLRDDPASQRDPHDPSDNQSHDLPRITPHDGSDSSLPGDDPTHSTHRAGRSGSAVRRPHVECLLLGHLPVLGGPWVAQYADRLAEEHGDAALVQLRPGDCSIEVFSPLTTDDAAAEVGRPTTEPADSAEQAIRLIGPTVQRWAVRVDGGDHARLLRCGVFDSITLLGGADEAAIVAAYRTFKELAAAGEQLERPLPALRYAVVGADEGASASAQNRIAQAARSFLQLAIEPAAAVRKIRPMNVAQVGRWTSVPQFADCLAWISGAVSRPIRLSTAAPVPPVAPERAHDVPDPIAGVCRSIADDGVTTDTPAVPAAVMQAVAPSTEASPEQRLASLTSHLPSLTPMAARCPRAASVELAIDADGRLHLLVRSDVSDAVSNLLAASAWAIEHRDVLALTQPDVEIDVDRSPMLHLFTDAAVTVRGLIDSQIKLHLLAESVNADRTIWVCVDLN